MPGLANGTIRARRGFFRGGFADDFGLVAADGVIAAAGPWREVRGQAREPVSDLGELTITPGLINCHAHLELSHLAGKVACGAGFTA